MIEKMLVPLDGSELADRAVGAARSLALASSAEVLLFSALEAELADGKPRDDAVEHLRLRAEELRADGVRARTLVSPGEAALAILDAAADFDPTLIVLASHGRTGEKRFVRGSVAERLLQRSLWPLLIVSPFAPRAERSFARILVPLDGSPEAARILPLAADVTRAHRSELILFHAIEDASRAPKDEAKRLLEHYRKQADGLPVRTLIRAGRAASAILDAADSERAELIALTTHGRSGEAHWLYGSVAEAVLHHARTPLLVLRTGE